MNLESHHAHKINRVVNYMRTHLDDPLNLQTLADVACISKYHFINVFQKYSGETPIQYLSRVRLEQAIDSLVYFPDLSITDVAYNCGYKNPLAFSRAFAKRFRISPSGYRSKNLWCFDQYPENQMQTIEYKRLNVRIPKIDKIKKVVEIRSWEESRLAYIRHKGGYGLKDSIRKLIHWAKRQDIWDDDSLIVGIVPHHPAVTPIRFCCYDVALPVCNGVVEDNVVSIQTIPRSTCAVLTLVIDTESGMGHAAWDWLIADWLPNSGMVRALEVPCFERYLQSYPDAEQSKFLMEFWLPVSKLQRRYEMNYL